MRFLNDKCETCGMFKYIPEGHDECPQCERRHMQGDDRVLLPCVLMALIIIMMVMA